MNDDERELRDALETRAAAVPVGRADEPGLLQRLVAARRRRRQARLAGAAAALVMVLGAASLVAADGPEGETVTVGPGPSSSTTIFDPTTTTPDTAPLDTTPTLPPPPPSSVAPGTTVAPAPAPTTVPRTTTTRAPLPTVPDDAVWPPPGSTTVFPDQAAAMFDFTRRFLGMANPQLIAVNTTGDTATMNVTPSPAAGISMVVSLRRVEGRGWVVTGSAAPSIQVDQPSAGARVASPLTVRGRTQAFEGHVDVEVRSDGNTTPIGRSFGTGASDAVAPFEATVTFTRPSTVRGTLVVSEPNAADGNQGPLTATVIRVSF